MLGSVLRRRMATAVGSGKVAFIGLGQMGSHMAVNLAKAGRELVLVDANRAAVEAVQARGAAKAAVAATAAEAASQAGTVITMLPFSRDAYLTGPDAVLAGARPGTLLIDCSTVAPTVSKEVAAAAEAKGMPFLDAPVSGGVGGAEAATLTFMCGGSEAAFAAALPLLKAMGKNTVHVGGPGAGGVAKLANNLVLGASMLAVAEAMALGARLGVDPKVLAGLINTSSGRCWSSDTYNPAPGVMPNVPSSRGYAGGFATALMVKDLNLALETAKAVEAPLPATHAAISAYQLAAECGLKGKDFSAIYALLTGQAPAVAAGGAAAATPPKRA